MQRPAPPRAAALLLTLLAAPHPARADEHPPIFAGHPALTRFTKEVALETTAARLDDGLALGGGAAVAAFYKPWFSPIAATSFTPSWLAPREHWEARAGTRFVLPRPLFGEIFGYALIGGSALFTAVDGQRDTFTRSYHAMYGLGLFGNVHEHVRLRVELRDHWRMWGKGDTRHAPSLSLAVVVLYR